MKALFITVLSLFAITLAKPAQASHHKHHRHYAHHHYRHYARHHRQHNDSVSIPVAYHDGRPSAWCGWYMRQIMHVADAAYNLAANWAHWGRPTEPHVGAVVVWQHHVGRIVGGSPGHWAVNSGNDGHAVKTRVRSVARAIAFREG